MTQLEMMCRKHRMKEPRTIHGRRAETCKTDYGQGRSNCCLYHDPRIYQTTVKEFLKDKKGAVCGVKTVKLESKKDEKSGRMVMTEVAGSEKVLNAELVLIAAGFLGTQKYVADAFGVKLNERTNVAVDQETYATSVERVYAAEMCEEASLWWFGQSARAERWQEQWMKV